MFNTSSHLGYTAALADLGIDIDVNNRIHLVDGVYNLYGLLIESLKYRSGSNQFTTLDRSGNTGGFNVGQFFINADEPSLETVDYYFVGAKQYYDFGEASAPVPGSPYFTVTNTSPLLIAGFGQTITVSGWAKDQNWRHLHQQIRLS